MKEILLRVWTLIRKRPVVFCFVAFLCLDMAFFSDFSVINSYRYSAQISQLRREVARYRKSINKDRMRLEELKSDEESLEKFARETYQMKRANEDVYIIIDEE